MKAPLIEHMEVQDQKQTYFRRTAKFCGALAESLNVFENGMQDVGFKKMSQAIIDDGGDHEGKLLETSDYTKLWTKSSQLIAELVLKGNEMR